jgi:hypothetical protein
MNISKHRREEDQNFNARWGYLKVRHTSPINLKSFFWGRIFGFLISLCWSLVSRWAQYSVIKILFSLFCGEKSSENLEFFRARFLETEIEKYTHLITHRTARIHTHKTTTRVF